MEFSKDSKVALVIGNGNSTGRLLEYGFNNIPKNIDTFATSGAYKYCKALNWWPTYYVLTDYKVLSHKVAIFNKFLTNKKIDTKKFYFTTYSKDSKKQDQLKFDDPYGKVVHRGHLESGISCLDIILNSKEKYDWVITIGIDNNYTWLTDKVEEVGDGSNRALIKERIKKHPSYFWKDYIEKGDILSWDFTAEPNIPTFSKNKHAKFDDNLLKLMDKNIRVVNCSESKYTGKRREEFITNNLYIEDSNINKYLNKLK